MGFHKRFITSDIIKKNIRNLGTVLSAESLFIDEECKNFVQDCLCDPDFVSNLELADDDQITKIFESYGIK